MTQTIELSENSIQILDKQHLTDKHIMFIKVGLGNMPRHKAQEYMEGIRLAFADKVAPAELIIIPSENSVEVFEKD